MAPDYNLDNDGTGFELDETGLESMFAEAAAGEEKDDMDASSFFANLNNDTPAQTVQSPAEQQPQVQQVQEPVMAVPEPTPTPVTNTPEIRQPVAESTPAPAPVTPTRQTIHMPTGESVARIKAILRISDVYRKLSADEQNVAGQFVANGQPIESEADFVSYVLNVNPSLRDNMNNLKQAKNLEAMERAFFVIDLPSDEMHDLGNLAGGLAEKQIDSSLRPNQYAREIVLLIEGLDNNVMRFVAATEKVLRAAEGDSAE